MSRMNYWLNRWFGEKQAGELGVFFCFPCDNHLIWTHGNSWYFFPPFEVTSPWTWILNQNGYKLQHLIVSQKEEKSFHFTDSVETCAGTWDKCAWDATSQVEVKDHIHNQIRSQKKNNTINCYASLILRDHMTWIKKNIIFGNNPNSPD